MAYAVSLLFNSSLADVVSEHWRRLADADVSRSMLDLAYPPHVTLVVYDTLRADVATVALDRIFENAAQIVVTLANVTTFGPGSGVLYAGLGPSPDLMRLQAITAAAIDEVCHPHYRTGNWTPHCTLATGLNNTDLGRARGILERVWRPQTGVFEAAALVEFAPVSSIKRWSLVRRPRSSRMP